MKTNCKLIYGVLLLGLLLMTACESKLDLTDPTKLNDDQISDLLVNGTDAQRELVIGGLAANLPGYVCYRNGRMYSNYSNMPYDNEYGQGVMRNLMCADMVYGTSKDVSSTHNWIFSYRNAAEFTPWDKDHLEFNYGYWNGGVDIITAANKVNQFITDAAANNSKSLMQYKARALTIWGLGYMELMERFTKSYLYGGKEGYGMPIYNKFAYNDIAKPETAEQTWTIVKDSLRKAIDLFSKCGYGANGFTVGSQQEQVYDIDRTLPAYYLARADLQTGDYSECITLCTGILDAYGWPFIKEEDYGVKASALAGICAKTAEAKVEDNAFLCIAKNPECIFGWTNDAQLYSWSFFNPFYGNDMKISSALYDMFDDNDFRKDNFSTEDVKYPFLDSHDNEVPSTIYKYTSLRCGATLARGYAARTTAHNNSDVTYIRTSEILLMLAEAQAKSGDESGAKTTLNKLLKARTRSGATTLTCDNYKGMSGKSAMDMVKLQWRMEMWGERDLAFYGYKRWNEKPVRDANDKCHWENTTVDINHMTWDIPEPEQSTNKYWIDVIYAK